MMPHVKPIKGVLFDLDGVLINSLAVMKMALGAALNEVYPKRNFDLDVLFKEYCQYLGMGFPQIMSKMDLSFAVHEPFRKHSRYLAPYVNLYSGVTDLLSNCAKANLTLGIATGKDLPRTQELLMQLRIDKYFSQILTSDTVEHPKPAPDMVLDFCKAQNLQPDEVVFLGDAEADIRCGQASGCITAAVAWGYSSFDELWQLSPDYLYASPEDATLQLSSLVDFENSQQRGA